MVLKDMQNIEIEVGDIVLFTEPGAGRNLPGLAFGLVVNLTKAGVTVKYLDKNFRPVVYEQGQYVSNGVMRDDRYGLYKNDKTWTKTGEIEKSPDNVRWYKDRFYIVRKP